MLFLLEAEGINLFLNSKSLEDPDAYHQMFSFKYNELTMACKLNDFEVLKFVKKKV